MLEARAYALTPRFVKGVHAARFPLRVTLVIPAGERVGWRTADLRTLPVYIGCKALTMVSRFYAYASAEHHLSARAAVSLAGESPENVAEACCLQSHGLSTIVELHLAFVLAT